MCIRDSAKTERLYARVVSVKDLGHVNAWHLAAFDDSEQCFKSLVRWDIHDGHDSSHPFLARVRGREYLYLYSNYRVPANVASVRDLGAYESFTYAAGGGHAKSLE